MARKTLKTEPVFQVISLPIQIGVSDWLINGVAKLTNRCPVKLTVRSNISNFIISYLRKRRRPPLTASPQPYLEDAGEST